MDFVISSLATLKFSNEFDDIYCKQKNDRNERQNAERQISGRQTINVQKNV